MAAARSDSSYASVAGLYDHIVLYRDRPDVTFYVDASKQSAGPVLEIGCGTGRILIPAARAGVEIVGLDASPYMLAVCRERLRAEPADVQSRVHLIEGDMRSFSLPRIFQLVTIPFRPFQHLLTVEDQLACLATIRHHLAPTGRLIFDLFNPSLDSLVNQPLDTETEEGPEFSPPDGRRVTRRYKLISRDRFQQVNHYEMIYYVSHPDGREERLTDTLIIRYLFRFEAEHLLARAGFTIEHLYGGFDKSPYGSSYPGDLIFVARKSA